MNATTIKIEAFASATEKYLGFLAVFGRRHGQPLPVLPVRAATGSLSTPCAGAMRLWPCPFSASRPRQRGYLNPTGADVIMLPFTSLANFRAPVPGRPSWKHDERGVIIFILLTITPFIFRSS